MENIIFYGVPGCGKSYYIDNEYIKKIIKYLFNLAQFQPISRDQVERVVFHQDYTYSDFIGQILPVIMDDPTTDKKLISYKFIPGPFTKILKKALKDNTEPQKPFFLIIEEINRGNAPAIFGDIFQLLDRNNINESQYKITNENIAEYIYGDTDCKIYIPNNLFLVGTMNTSDQNVFTLDTAFQRRWNMELIPNDIDKCSFRDKKILDTSVKWEDFWKMVNNTISKLSLDSFGSEDKRLGAFFIKEEFLIDENAKYFAGKVIKYLWDDAFKMNRSDIFNTEYYPTLEEIINIGFLKTDKDDRYRIFKGKIKEEINKLINANNDGTKTPNPNKGTDTTTSNGDNINNIDVNQTPESTEVDADATAETKTGINNSSENKEPAQKKNKDNSEE